MKLENILEGVEVEYIKGIKDINIDNITYDSRNVTSNTMFICIRGYEKDGHDYIEEAFKKGARVFLIDKDVDFIEGSTYIKTRCTRKSMSKIASNFNQDSQSRLNVIGVTGTNGKTTSTYLIRDIFKQAQKKCGLLGTIEMDDGKDIIKADRTTPESLEIHKEFKSMIQNGCETCVMEVSSHSLELYRVEDVEFSISLFTNLTKDHLDFHKTMESYMESKKKLFYKTNGYCVINIDDYWGKKIYNNLLEDSKKTISFGLDKDCDFRAVNINLGVNQVEYDLLYPNGEVHVKLPIPGLFSVYNSLGAICVAYLSNIDMDDILKGLEFTKKVPGRFEVIGQKNGFNVIVDFAHSPDALEKALKTARDFTSGRLICVFGCCGNRDKTKRPIMGKIAQVYSDYFIITSDDPRFEDPSVIIEEVISGINIQLDNYETIVDRKEAVKRAISIGRQGDTILLAGKGHEDYIVIGDEKIPYDERKTVKELLEED